MAACASMFNSACLTSGRRLMISAGIPTLTICRMLGNSLTSLKALVKLEGKVPSKIAKLLIHCVM